MNWTLERYVPQVPCESTSPANGWGSRYLGRFVYYNSDSIFYLKSTLDHTRELVCLSWQQEAVWFFDVLRQQTSMETAVFGRKQRSMLVKGCFFSSVRICPFHPFQPVRVDLEVCQFLSENPRGCSMPVNWQFCLRCYVSFRGCTFGQTLKTPTWWIGPLKDMFLRCHVNQPLLQRGGVQDILDLLFIITVIASFTWSRRWAIQEN